MTITKFSLSPCAEHSDKFTRPPHNYYVVGRDSRVVERQQTFGRRDLGSTPPAAVSKLG